MSLETRSSAHFKRAEQLRRWEDSETNREPTVPKVRSSKVKFPSSCVFLAACTAGDKDEVLKLLEKGIDINTPNVDGLTALHQACIEDNLDMVEFLVQNGANVNLGDNEGWTPLHATASCGFCSIAKYLIENGADVGAINNDGELAIDIAESDDMLDLLQDEIQKRGIDCEKARGDEQRRMLKDARDWASGECIESMGAPHHKTGATALHIAAAKGYIDVMHILLQNGLVDVDQQDYDGWTPLHAATHWNQREAAKLLVDNLADMEIKNFYRQTPFDVADPDMLKFLEELKVKQSSLNKEIILGKRQAKRKADAPAKIKKVELQIEKDKENDENLVGSVDNNVDLELSLSSDTDSYSSETETSSDNFTDEEKKNRVNAGTTDSSQRIYPPSSPATTPTSEQNNSTKQLPSPTQQAPPSVPPKAIENNTEDIGTIPSWRRPASLRSRLGNDSPTKSLSLRIGEKEQKSPTSPTSKNISDNSDVVLRRTHSFENDEKFKRRYMELQERIKKAKSLYPIPGTPQDNNKTSSSYPPSNSNSNNDCSNEQTYFITKLGLLPSPQKPETSSKNNNNHNNHTIHNNNNISPSTYEDDDQKFIHFNRKHIVSDSILSKVISTTNNPLTRSCSLRTDRWLSDRKQDQLTNTTTTSSSGSSPQQNTPSTPPTATINTANTSPNRTSQSSPIATSPQPNSQVRSVTHKPPVSGASPVTTIVTPATPPTPSVPTPTPPPATPSTGSKLLSPGNIFKNFFKSFVPPVRDEESETQRKAHAKRVRETRRSTQGVTLDEIKSAEQLVKQKNQPKNATDQDVTTTVVVTSTSNGDTTSTNGNNTPSVTATITTGAPTVVTPVTRTNEDSDQQNIQNNSLHERRPSWRLRVDNGSKFKLEDATATNNATTAGGTPTVFIRRAATTTPSGQITTRPSSAPVETTVPPSPPADTVVTLPLRRNSKPVEDKEQDKENDVRNAQATQAVIQRRRRPKRRSTGVVHVDMDEIDPEKQDSNAGGDCDDIKLNHQDSGSEQQGNNNKESRLSASRGELIPTRNENGEVDYKKLWEQAQADNDRLRDKLRKQDEELRDTKLTLEKISTTSKNSLSELEKRERRAMERKLSEMEEELKQLQKLKAENERLRAENRALTRVVSKLTNTTGK
ncbi:protein phosphatase 1 regulatory subunit 12A isoform X4 [Chrysoperla carnea]|uniref:protein phosphatase 1 regulatory subunit 12A isoform X4 n=1 Tax=Chrysoperla carnea TaxID=189513 RepID=UPI001D08266A|nr:protein phosphatase 1 regulatory subunit 12A isoform X4 [Chrysoperla carnea]